MTDRYKWHRIFLLASYLHAVYSSFVFVLIAILLGILGGDAMRFWNYRNNAGDVRVACHPVALATGLAILAIFSIWDYVALGAVLSANDQRRSNDNLPLYPGLYTSLWCYRNANTNERLTDACHGICDRPYGRVLMIVIRIAIVSMLFTISGMNVLIGFEHSDPSVEDERIYSLTMVIAVCTFLETPVSICACILHTVYTYHWIESWHRIEIMAVSLGEDSVSFSDSFTER